MPPQINKDGLYQRDLFFSFDKPTSQVTYVAASRSSKFAFELYAGQALSSLRKPLHHRNHILQRDWEAAADWKSAIADKFDEDENTSSGFDEPWYVQQDIYTQDSTGVFDCVVFEVDVLQFNEHLLHRDSAWIHYVMNEYEGRETISKQPTLEEPERPAQAFFINQLSNALKIVAITDSKRRVTPSIPWSCIKCVYDYNTMKPIWCSTYNAHFMYGHCQPLNQFCNVCNRASDGRTTCDHPNLQTSTKPATFNMSPWITPISELLQEIEIWTATSENTWCLKLFFVEDIFRVRTMWQRMRQTWVALTQDTKIWPSSLWFQVWLLRNSGVRTWKNQSINPLTPEALYNVEKDWIALDLFLGKKPEQQAAHDIMIGEQTEHKIFLLCSMLAIFAKLIADHMRTWFDTPQGTFDATNEPEVIMLEKFVAQMREFKYRDPIRPVEATWIDRWAPRNVFPTTSHRWTQMPGT